MDRRRRPAGAAATNIERIIAVALLALGLAPRSDVRVEVGVLGGLLLGGSDFLGGFTEAGDGRDGEVG